MEPLALQTGMWVTIRVAFLHASAVTCSIIIFTKCSFWQRKIQTKAGGPHRRSGVCHLCVLRKSRRKRPACRNNDAGIPPDALVAQRTQQAESYSNVVTSENKADITAAETLEIEKNFLRTPIFFVDPDFRLSMIFMRTPNVLNVNSPKSTPASSDFFIYCYQNHCFTILFLPYSFFAATNRAALYNLG